MASSDSKQKKSTKTKTASSSWDGWFINVELTEADKKTIKNWDFDHVRVWEWLASLLAQGFKFSVGITEDGTAYMASLTSRDPNSAAYQGTLTARGRTSELAVAILYYKETSLLMGIWPGRREKDEDMM